MSERTQVGQKRKLAELLEEVKLELPHKLKPPRFLDQKDIAVQLGVSNTSFSQWITMTRLPTGANVKALADGLAKFDQHWTDRLWDILDIPVPVPDDLQLLGFTTWWHYVATPQDKAEFREKIKHDLENATNADPTNKNTVPA